MATEPTQVSRELAAKVVSDEIAGALQLKISQWQAERSKIEALIQREDRKRDRYELLGALITQAQKEIDATAIRLGETAGAR